MWTFYILWLIPTFEKYQTDLIAFSVHGIIWLSGSAGATWFIQIRVKQLTLFIEYNIKATLDWVQMRYDISIYGFKSTIFGQQLDVTYEIATLLSIYYEKTRIATLWATFPIFFWDLCSRVDSLYNFWTFQRITLSQWNGLRLIASHVDVGHVLQQVRDNGCVSLDPALVRVQFGLDCGN